MTTIGFGDFVPVRLRCPSPHFLPNCNLILCPPPSQDYEDNAGLMILHTLYILISLSVYSYLINVAVVMLASYNKSFTQNLLHRMDIEGDGHVGLNEVVSWGEGDEIQSSLKNIHPLLTPPNSLAWIFPDGSHIAQARGVSGVSAHHHLGRGLGHQPQD